MANSRNINREPHLEAARAALPKRLIGRIHGRRAALHSPQDSKQAVRDRLRSLTTPSVSANHEIQSDCRYKNNTDKCIALEERLIDSF
jgi:hypothetical protein